MKEPKSMKRLDWKSGTLIITIFVLLSVLFLTFFWYETGTWLVSIVFPMILSAVASIGVSLWFTIKTEKEALYRALLIERDRLFQYGFQLMNNIDSIMCCISYSLLSKKRMMMNSIREMPAMFWIPRLYPEQYILYHDKKKDLLGIVERIQAGKGELCLASDDPIYVEYMFCVAEIMDNTLRLQEQILQDFKMIPKGPIPDQLISNMSSEKKPDNKSR